MKDGFSIGLCNGVRVGVRAGWVGAACSLSSPFCPGLHLSHRRPIRLQDPPQGFDRDNGSELRSEEFSRRQSHEERWVR